ncbi:inositol monophosphatase family protein [Glutamicibacter protophormiae]|uniref:Fructose-1, 6-bisphosphatase/inositol-1-monophosphatase n=1 Tax=Kocuria varians TaxID=1272 RepID=A0A7D7L088_KOCVA|nr:MULTISPECIES: inositol monophosphatase family protein [Kocuria]WNB87712.1 inositol monophosphatase family protein [Glutamicibacter protophormiae]MDN5632253.1 inositol monophosphatase [Kocuria sp.]QMS56707.1 Fructose-1,6-bisphosphatase/inositol-1-monophosphatase [Kocuria varians]RUP83554.1 inositol monophosphatase [Kocuria sp. HSID17590]RUQ06533.1 inositol monophosphatase [Kocuria sp. HSID17582]
MPDALEGLGPGTDELEDLLAVALEAAEAGAQVLRGRDAAQLNAVNKSSDGDWVTAFDVAAEEAVGEVLRRARPYDAITGEESGTYVPPRRSGVRWSVDPLDGTTNFIRDIVYYATSVAACDDHGNWLVGVVNAPALGRVYYAVAGLGAWVRRNGGDTRLTGPVPSRRGALYGTGFSYDAAVRREQFGTFLETMENFSDMRRLGAASLDLCMVAEGTLDGYSERGLHEHDWAAGALIAHEAGAVVERPDLPPPPALCEQEHTDASAMVNAYEKARVASVIAAWAAN